MHWLFAQMPSFFASCIKNRELWCRLTEREIQGRYKGSMLGISWTFITPLAMLAVYTFVFSQVFKARWGGIEESGSLAFAANLFAGLIVFNLFGECINKAPSLIISNPNFVKKIIFPLQVLGTVCVGGAVFNALTSLLVLIVFELIAFHRVPPTLLWIPIVWLPLILVTLGCTWALSALGVFIRDIGQIIGVALNMLLFMSPIFYPASALPTKMQPFIWLNPLAQVIEETRRIAIQGLNPHPSYIIIGISCGIAVCELGFRGFKKSSGWFADVI